MNNKQVRAMIDGKEYVVLVPEFATESQYSRGVIVGPPDLSVLGLPSELELRLHKELLNRGLITAKDARQRTDAVLGAWQAAMKVSVSDLLNLYAS